MSEKDHQLVEKSFGIRKERNLVLVQKSSPRIEPGFEQTRSVVELPLHRGFLSGPLSTALILQLVLYRFQHWRSDGM